MHKVQLLRLPVQLRKLSHLLHRQMESALRKLLHLQTEAVLNLLHRILQQTESEVLNLQQLQIQQTAEVHRLLKRPLKLSSYPHPHRLDRAMCAIANTPTRTAQS